MPLVNGSFRSVYLALLLSLGLSLSAGLNDVKAQAAEESMEDMCAGDMQWMIGWCLDMVMVGELPEVASLSIEALAQSRGTFERIDVLGATGTRAFGINPQGDIVGSYTDAAGTHGFLLSNGALWTIDYPGASSTETWGINAGGDIIGRYTRTGTPGTRGFLLSHGHFTDISIGNAPVTLPTKIGASGEIVGCYHTANTLVDMFAYKQRGNDVELFVHPSNGAPAGTSATMHNGVAPGGDTVVGLQFPAAGQARGYVLSRGTLTFLNAPGSTNTQAWDVNPTGIIIGQYAAGGRVHGFSYEGGEFTAIDVPGSTMTVARGISPRGDIVGVFNDAAGAHGFVLRK
jgi:uncharacterized membrane protein